MACRSFVVCGALQNAEDLTGISSSCWATITSMKLDLLMEFLAWVHAWLDILPGAAVDGMFRRGLRRLSCSVDMQAISVRAGCGTMDARVHVRI